MCELNNLKKFYFSLNSNFMNKLIFVTGAAGTGKSTYIQNRFADSEKFYVFDMALESKKVFGSFGAIADDDLIVDIYNSLSEDAMFALLDDLDMVVEYCTDGYDDDLFALVKEARIIGLPTEIIHLTIDSGEAIDRLALAKNNSLYFPSQKFKEDSLIILSGVMESYAMNRGFEVVCELAAGEETVKLFRIVSGEEEQFFYMSNDAVSFDFEPQFEFEKMTGVNYVKQFHRFTDAFENLQKEYPVFSLTPVNINANYKSKFRKAYQKLLDGKNAKMPSKTWDQFLN